MSALRVWVTQALNGLTKSVKVTLQGTSRGSAIAGRDVMRGPPHLSETRVGLNHKQYTFAHTRYRLVVDLVEPSAC